MLSLEHGQGEEHGAASPVAYLETREVAAKQCRGGPTVAVRGLVCACACAWKTSIAQWWHTQLPRHARKENRQEQVLMGSSPSHPLLRACAHATCTRICTRQHMQCNMQAGVRTHACAHSHKHTQARACMHLRTHARMHAWPPPPCARTHVQPAPLSCPSSPNLSALGGDRQTNEQQDEMSAGRKPRLAHLY